MRVGFIPHNVFGMQGQIANWGTAWDNIPRLPQTRHNACPINKVSLSVEYSIFHLGI